MFDNQKTIKHPIEFEGIGLHNGENVKIKLVPEKVDTGIYFQLAEKSDRIPAIWKYGNIAQLCTKIKRKNLTLSTIEHLMSALSGLGISNLKIISSNTEIPIMDGSSRDFVKKIIEVGILDQNKKKTFIKIKKKIEIKKNDKFITIEPIKNNNFEIDLTIKYNDVLIKKQNFKYVHNFNNYLKIYNARTFCFQDDLEKIFSMGLAKGGSLENAIVISGKKILNQGGLRYPDEFVKHKVLDCVGDIYLAGSPIIGKVISYQGGHEMNLLLLNEIFKNPHNYEILKNLSFDSVKKKYR